LVVYLFTWSAVDKTAIQAGYNALRAKGHGPEAARVVAQLAQIARNGQKALGRNIHTQVNGRNLHSICPFGIVGAYYAYANLPAQELYQLGYFENHYLHFGTAAQRLSNVP
jgi:hypothetical protein